MTAAGTSAKMIAAAKRPEDIGEVVVISIASGDAVAVAVREFFEAAQDLNCSQK